MTSHASGRIPAPGRDRNIDAHGQIGELRDLQQGGEAASTVRCERPARNPGGLHQTVTSSVGALEPDGVAPLDRRSTARRARRRSAEFLFVDFAEQLTLGRIRRRVRDRGRVRPTGILSTLTFARPADRARLPARPSPRQLPRSGADLAWCSIASSALRPSVSSAAMSRSSAAGRWRGPPSEPGAAPGSVQRNAAAAASSRGSAY